MQTIDNRSYTEAAELSRALAKITRNPALTAGVFLDAVNMIAREGCIALKSSRIGIWMIEHERNVLSNSTVFEHETGEYGVQDRKSVV